MERKDLSTIIGKKIKEHAKGGLTMHGIDMSYAFSPDYL